MFRYITDTNDRIELTTEYVGLDVETDGLNIRKNKILLIQLSDGINTYVIDSRILPKQYFVDLFTRFKDKKFIAHNAKFDIGMIFSNYGYLLENIHDTMIAEAVLYSGKTKLMKSLADIVSCRYNLELDKTLQSSFLTPAREFTQDQLEYAARDAEILIQVYLDQMQEITEGGFSTIMQLENNLTPVVMKMEYNGVVLSPERLFPVIERESQKADEYEQQLFQIAGREFNPRSPKQVKEVFHEIGKRTGNKRLCIDSTGVEVLKYIKHPLARTILNYRSSSKLVSTYGMKLVERIEDDGKVHCTFNQYGTETGRFSSSSFNLQNIPATQEFRTPFIASEGYKFLTADYSQIELRLAGIVSGETEIINEYRKENADLHALTASKVFELPLEEISKEQRSHGKTGNFELLYGSYYKSVAERQGISEELAKKISDGFWNGYPILESYKNRVGSETLKNEYSRTPLGRIRYFQRPSSTDPAYKYKIGRIQREGFNMVIQGYAADIMKYAIIMVDKALGDSGRIILTVHDEIGVEVKEDRADEISQLVLDKMEESATMLVKGVLHMKAEGHLGESWTK